MGIKTHLLSLISLQKINFDNAIAQLAKMQSAMHSQVADLFIPAEA